MKPNWRLRFLWFCCVVFSLDLVWHTYLVFARPTPGHGYEWACWIIITVWMWLGTIWYHRWLKRTHH